MLRVRIHGIRIQAFCCIRNPDPEPVVFSYYQKFYSRTKAYFKNKKCALFIFSISLRSSKFFGGAFSLSKRIFSAFKKTIFFTFLHFCSPGPDPASSYWSGFLRTFKFAFSPWPDHKHYRYWCLSFYFCLYFFASLFAILWWVVKLVNIVPLLRYDDIEESSRIRSWIRIH